MSNQKVLNEQALLSQLLEEQKKLAPNKPEDELFEIFVAEHVLKEKAAKEARAGV